MMRWFISAGRHQHVVIERIIRRSVNEQDVDRKDEYKLTAVKYRLGLH